MTRSTTATTSSSPTATRSTSPSASPASVCNIRTVAGTGGASSTGDGGQGTAATVNTPFGMAVNGTALLISEETGARLRRLDLVTGIITTIAGTGSSTGAYAGVAATSANIGTLGQPIVLPNGDVAVGSRSRCILVGISAATQVTYVVAGNGACLSGTAASGVAANATSFGSVRFAAVWNDSVFVSSWDHRVRLVNLTTGAFSWSEARMGDICITARLAPLHPLQAWWRRGSTRQAQRATVGMVVPRCRQHCTVPRAC